MSQITTGVTHELDAARRMKLDLWLREFISAADGDWMVETLAVDKRIERNVRALFAEESNPAEREPGMEEE